MTQSAEFLGSLVQPAVVAVIAAWLTHYLRERSDSDRSRKDYLASKLEQAYELLVDSIEIPGLGELEQSSRKQSLQKALNTIDLYADKKIKDLAVQIVKQYDARTYDWILYTPLMTALRDKFREEMNFDRLAEPVHLIKFEFVPNNEKSTTDVAKDI